MTRRLSGFKPTGHLHLGNYLGAIRPVVDAQYTTESVAMVADLHALTIEHHPARVRALSREVAAMLIAAGADPERCVCYLQSHLPEHTELHYLLECATRYGEAHRMIQFKEKAARRDDVRLSLLTYPVLMAADVLLHDTDEVPVGEDQSQHLELARDVATRFNARYGEVFVVPTAVNPPLAARLMDLTDPRAKMGKSTSSDAGVIYLLDPPEVLRRKVMRAVTDNGTEIRYDPRRKLGVSNLLEILAACSGDDPATIAGLFGSYQELKEAVADTVIAMLRPIQARHADLRGDRRYLDLVLAEGADRARGRATATVRRAREAIGLVPAATLTRR